MLLYREMKNKSQKYLVAVSGGVDSVVLLDRLISQRASVVVAHFDHGIRPDSAKDADFVRQLAKNYNVPFFTERQELGADASEDLARQERYQFLNQVAQKENAVVTTAHHLDDVVESVAINLMRGTGWRGLAVMGAANIYRPLLDWTKKDITSYAKKHHLKWREDPTNQSNVYTRNIVRRQLMVDDETKIQLKILFDEQSRLAEEIKSEVTSLLKNLKQSDYKLDKKSDIDYSRYFISNIDRASAYEIIRELTEGYLEPAQIDQVILANKTFQAGTVYQASKNVKFTFGTRLFTVKLLK